MSGDQGAPQVRRTAMGSTAPVRSRRAARASLAPYRIRAALAVAFIWLGGLACIFPPAWGIISSLPSGATVLTDPLGFARQTFESYKAVLSAGDLGTGF